MSDTREYPKGNSRQIMDYNRFLSLTGNKIFLCLDAGIIQVCKYLLNSRGGWRTSYATEWRDFEYVLPTETEFQVLTNAIAEANIDMASCDDIVTALQGIQGAIQQQASSGGCGCVGSGDDDVTSVNDTPSQDIPPSGDWAEHGFPSEAAYDEHRCGAAQYVIDGYVGTLRNWGGLAGTIGGLTLAVITGLLLLTVPPVGLMLIMAALGTLVGINFALLSSLTSIAQEIEDNTDLLCDLYNAGTTEEAADIIRAAAAAAITDLALSPAATFQQITDNLISNEALEAMFNPAGPTAEADCSSCVGSISPWTVVYGTASNSSPANPILGNGTYEPGYGCLLNARHFGVSFAEPASVSLFTVDGVLAPVCSGGPTYFYYSDDNFTTLISSTNVAPQTAPAVGIRSMYVVWDGSGIGDDVVLQQEPY